MSAVVAKADPQTARGAHQGSLGIDLHRFGDGVGQGNIDDPTVAPRHHAVETPGRYKIDRMDAERRGDEAVTPSGSAAALEVTQDCHPRLRADRLGDGVTEETTDPA